MRTLKEVDALRDRLKAEGVPLPAVCVRPGVRSVRCDNVKHSPTANPTIRKK